LFNLRNRNGNPFKGEAGDYRDVKLAFVLSFLFFVVSGLVVLRNQDDLSSYCVPVDPAVNATFEQVEMRSNHIDYAAGSNLTSPLMKLFYSIDKMSYLSTEAKCYTYTTDEVYSYNYNIWTLGFFIGL